MRSIRTCAILLVLFGSCDTPEVHEGPMTPHHIRTLAFYNVENLFDTVNDSLIMDDERTPQGRDRWTEDRYRDKLSKIARVLSDIGREEARRIPDLIGLCEVENRQVLEDLISQPELKEADYGIIHFDSPDRRGIDVALLYRKDVFTVLEQESRRLALRTRRNQRKYTRDQLVVFGYLDGQPIYISVNHWPSRSGGQVLSEPFRRQAAALQRSILDSVLRLDPEACFISLGDYNDEPTDISLQYGLGTRDQTDSLPPYLYYNPMSAMYQAGTGSLAYRDRWSLFDQILLNGNWFEDLSQYKFWKAGIYSPEFLKTTDGPYKGYPFRTYAGGKYQGGYSDHFPVYAFLIRPVGKSIAE